jgi:S-DNA-T family DNA segregation ATPase FtsK/SpoIIIE
VPVPAGARIADAGFARATVLDLSGALRWKADALTLRLRVSAGEVCAVDSDRGGRDVPNPVGRPDALSEAGARALARCLAPLRLAADRAQDPLGTDRQLHELLGIADAAAFDPEEVWAQRAGWDRLRVPIGLAPDGTALELDIKESAQGGMGPHGMLIGATGSGKSELLRTLVLALACTHSPEVLNFVLIDFKGGATFVGLDRLPHLSAMITNLADELPLVDRMQDALQGELVRRQELLRRTGYSALAEYERARAQGKPLDPLPTLFVVVDEFSEMLSTRRELSELFVMIGRLGRSLGVHLLLASQRLEEGRIHMLESHLSYRIGLRTFSASESRSVLGVPDAYELPSAPGNGYLKTGTAAITRFKATYVSGSYHGRRTRRYGAAAAARQVLAFGTEPAVRADGPDQEPGLDAPGGGTGAGPTAPTPPDSPEAASADRDSLLRVLADRLEGRGPAARQVWLPPLDRPPTLDEVLPPLEPDPLRGLTAAAAAGGGPRPGGLTVSLGLVDRPLEGVRELLEADLSGSAGHVAVVGGPQRGKSTLVRTLIAALALTHTPAEVQFYCVDLGGGMLAQLAGLPHIGGVATRQDPDRIARTLAELTDLLHLREAMFTEHGVESMESYRSRRGEPWAAADRHGDAFLVIDGWLTFRQDFEQLEPLLSPLANRGLTYGIHLVIVSGRWSDIRPWLRDLLGTRFELRLGDPVDSEVNARAAAAVPERPGRGLTRQGLHFIAALPRIDGGAGATAAGEAARALAEAVADQWSGARAPEVRTLPARLPAAALPEPDGDLRMALGLDQNRLAPVHHDFAADAHLLVLGDPESGKSNLLRLAARAIQRRYGAHEAGILLADYRRDLADWVPERYRLGYAVSGASLEDLAADAAEVLRERLPGPDIPPDRLPRRDWWTGRRLFVLVDDYELVQNGGQTPLAPLLDLLPQGAHIGLHVVLARGTAGAARAMGDPLIRQLWELGSPALLLSCKKDEGAFLGNVRPLTLPAGRAQWVTRRRAVHIIQTAHLEQEARTP